MDIVGPMQRFTLVRNTDIPKPSIIFIDSADITLNETIAKIRRLLGSKADLALKNRIRCIQ
jgi:hypothetical protein